MATIAPLLLLFPWKSFLRKLFNNAKTMRPMVWYYFLGALLLFQNLAPSSSSFLSPSSLSPSSSSYSVFPSPPPPRSTPPRSPTNPPQMCSPAFLIPPSSTTSSSSSFVAPVHRFTSVVGKSATTSLLQDGNGGGSIISYTLLPTFLQSMFASPRHHHHEEGACTTRRQPNYPLINSPHRLTHHLMAKVGEEELPLTTNHSDEQDSPVVCRKKDFITDTALQVQPLIKASSHWTAEQYRAANIGAAERLREVLGTDIAMAAVKDIAHQFRTNRIGSVDFLEQCANTFEATLSGPKDLNVASSLFAAMIAVLPDVEKRQILVERLRQVLTKQTAEAEGGGPSVIYYSSDDGLSPPKSLEKVGLATAKSLEELTLRALGLRMGREDFLDEIRAQRRHAPRGFRARSALEKLKTSELIAVYAETMQNIGWQVKPYLVVAEAVKRMEASGQIETIPKKKTTPEKPKGNSSASSVTDDGDAVKDEDNNGPPPSDEEIRPSLGRTMLRRQPLVVASAIAAVVSTASINQIVVENHNIQMLETQSAPLPVPVVEVVEFIWTEEALDIRRQCILRTFQDDSAWLPPGVTCDIIRIAPLADLKELAARMLARSLKAMKKKSTKNTTKNSSKPNNNNVEIEHNNVNKNTKYNHNPPPPRPPARLVRRLFEEHLRSRVHELGRVLASLPPTEQAAIEARLCDMPAVKAIQTTRGDDGVPDMGGIEALAPVMDEADLKAALTAIQAWRPQLLKRAYSQMRTIMISDEKDDSQKVVSLDALTQYELKATLDLVVYEWRRYGPDRVMKEETQVPMADLVEASENSQSAQQAKLAGEHHPLRIAELNLKEAKFKTMEPADMEAVASIEAKDLPGSEKGDSSKIDHLTREQLIEKLPFMETILPEYDFDPSLIASFSTARIRDLVQVGFARVEERAYQPTLNGPPARPTRDGPCRDGMLSLVSLADHQTLRPSLFKDADPRSLTIDQLQYVFRVVRDRAKGSSGLEGKIGTMEPQDDLEEAEDEVNATPPLPLDVKNMPADELREQKMYEDAMIKMNTEQKEQMKPLSRREMLESLKSAPQELIDTAEVPEKKQKELYSLNSKELADVFQRVFYAASIDGFQFNRTLRTFTLKDETTAKDLSTSPSAHPSTDNIRQTPRPAASSKHLEHRTTASGDTTTANDGERDYALRGEEDCLTANKDGELSNCEVDRADDDVWTERSLTRVGGTVWLRTGEMSQLVGGEDRYDPDEGSTDGDWSDTTAEDNDDDDDNDEWESEDEQTNNSLTDDDHGGTLVERRANVIEENWRMLPKQSDFDKADNTPPGPDSETNNNAGSSLPAKAISRLHVKDRSLVVGLSDQLEFTGNVKEGLPPPERPQDSIFLDANDRQGMHEALGESEEEDLVKFKELGLSDNTLKGIRSTLGHGVKPTPVQAMVIPPILDGSNVTFAAETGSGKTLAYLLPLAQALKETEDSALYLPRQPRALILVPTRELGDQIYRIAKQLSHTMKISSASAIGGDTLRVQRSELSEPLDVLVGTPARMLLLRQRGALALGNASHVVVDEVDNMLIQGFADELKELLSPIFGGRAKEVDFIYTKSVKKPPQVIATTATMSTAVKKIINSSYLPKVQFLEAPNLHKALPNVRHQMIQTKGRDKIEILLDVLNCSKVRGQTMVFCNTVKSAIAVHYAIKDAGLDCIGYHGDVPQSIRDQYMKKFRDGHPPLLVSTDLAARGLDFPNVEQVVMFDFPLNPIDYLHRAGRTGRMGRKGQVVSLVTKKDMVLGIAIDRSIRISKSLACLTGNKDDYKPGGPLVYLTQAGGYGRRKRDVNRPMRRSKVRRGGYTEPKSEAWHADRAAKMKEERLAKEKLLLTPKEQHNQRMETKNYVGRMKAMTRLSHMRGKR
eukprot:GHVS01042506.1.p1 GENE.GHVS01042506.1~~GHVS01042506.1.p1  ORF type:complete len:1883 (+),score=347.92 GHVS01042506.1:175-5823(+)